MATRAVVLGKLTQIGTITIDACKDETHTLTNTVTDHPVEEGFNISDHVRPDPDMVTLSCFVSNTPLSTDQQTRANQEGGNSSAQTNADGSVKIIQIPGRGKATFDKLKKLRDEGTLIEVVTTLKTYGVSADEGMVVQSLTVPRNTKNYDGLEFSVTLKQIRVVRNRQTRQTQAKDKRVGPKNKKGNQVATAPEDEDTALSKALDAGTGGKFSSGALLRGQ